MERGNLVLTVKRHERVYLTLPDGRDIVATVVEAWGDKARLAIQAPKDVKILREKLVAEGGDR